MSRRGRLAKGKQKVESGGWDTDRTLLTFPASDVNHPESVYWTENHFLNATRKLTDYNDYEILQLFDIFGKILKDRRSYRGAHTFISPDRDQKGTIEWREFFLFIAMLAAREECQCLEFLLDVSHTFVLYLTKTCIGSCMGRMYLIC